MILTLQCGVKYTCHFLSKNPDDPGYITFLFDKMDHNFRIISLLHGLPRRKEKKSYKAIICLFYIPEAPLAGFSTLPSLYCFIRVSLKIPAVIKTATMSSRFATCQALC